MDIRINGEAVDVTLESEQTLGAILSGIENWLGGSEFRVNGLEIDGETIPGNGLPDAFYRDLQGIQTIDIRVCSRQELMLEALAEARCYLRALANPPSELPAPADNFFDGSGSSLAESWKNSAAASFLSAELPEIYKITDDLLVRSGPETYSDAGWGSPGDGASASLIISLIDERIREIGDPAEEFERIEPLIAGISERLEELPLDIQTGKDGRAAETVTLFSNAAEKLFRLHFIFQSRGKFIDTVDSAPVNDFFEEFNTALKELLAAFTGKDSVLVGDLAEYELAPRLRAFYAALKKPIVSLV
jgi:hypothetical protein